MKILYLITSLEGGGAQQLLIDVCCNMKEKHDVILAYIQNCNVFEKPITNNGIKTVLINSAELGVIKTISAIKHLIETEKPDILHTHLVRADSLGRIAGLMVPNLRIISTIHCEDEWKKNKKIPFLLLKLFNRITVNRWKRVELIACSNSVKNFCVKYEKINPEKIKGVYNCVNFDNRNKTDPKFVPNFEKGDNFVLITCTRLEPHKRVSFILEAVKKMVKEYNEKILFIIMGTYTKGGKIERPDSLEHYIIEHGLFNNVKMFGFKKNVFDYLKMADAFVLASDTEGQSIAVLEAFLCKTTVLTSNIPSQAELLDNGNRGILFDNRNLQDFIGKLKSVIDGQADTETMKKNAYDFCCSLSVDSHTNELLKIYNQI